MGHLSLHPFAVSLQMGVKRVMPRVEEIVLSDAKYERQVVQAPHLTGLWLKFFVNILEIPLIGSTILYFVKKQNNVSELLRNTVIPDQPMFKPEFPPQDPESGVVVIDEDSKPEERVELALQCLPSYDPSIWWSGEMTLPFRFHYWKIRDYAYAYRNRIVTPNAVAENIISAIEECSNCEHPSPFLISFDANELIRQAKSSTKRFEEGEPLSILDGIFVAIKDDIDCYPHPSKGATTWFHEVRSIKKDSVSVSRLRQCGVILVGKANMHELGMGTTGNNPNYGTTRNPHCSDRYTGGSSSGPAAIVASGLCSAALGTDGGGSIRIPSSLCGVVGLKTTFERTDMTGSLCDGGTVAVIGPIASSVEDVMLVYAAIVGSSFCSQISMKPPPPCFPNLSSHDHYNTIGSVRLGKYTEWFNDVYSRDVSEKCEYILQLLTETHGCNILEITIPELHLMQTAHVVSIGSEALSSLSPYLSDGQGTKLTYDVRTNMALFQTFTASDFLAAQRLRRRLMYYHLEIFKTVDFIVTPTTGMTAPIIPPGAHESGETDLRVSGYLMRFVLAGNLLGLPAISIPVGYDREGLPIGMQLIGRPWSEASLLRLASVIEHMCSSTEKKSPHTFYQVLNPSSC